MSLDVSHISHRFAAMEAVRDATLSVESGEIVCLFGPSGCGKTTLLRIIAGHEPCQSGSICLNGMTLAAPEKSQPPETRPIGFVFQDFALFPHLTVRRNIGFGADKKNTRAAVDEQIEAMDLHGLDDRYPHELSGGQQQRVALARALIRKPEALLLDEPFASIDLVLRRRLREQLRAMLKRESAPTVIVTHDPEEALALGDRIVLMREGAFVEIATPEELYRAPKTIDGANLFPGGQIIEGTLRDGKFKSKFGISVNTNLTDGPAVAVLRAGAVSAALQPGPFRIRDCRFLGERHLVLIENTDGETIWANADKPGAVGETTGLSVRSDRIYVFHAQAE